MNLKRRAVVREINMVRRTMRGPTFEGETFEDQNQPEQASGGFIEPTQHTTPVATSGKIGPMTYAIGIGGGALVGGGIGALVGGKRRRLVGAGIGALVGSLLGGGVSMAVGKS